MFHPGEENHPKNLFKDRDEGSEVNGRQVKVARSEWCMLSAYTRKINILSKGLSGLYEKQIMHQGFSR
jgi:hypothetical protein